MSSCTELALPAESFQPPAPKVTLTVPVPNVPESSTRYTRPGGVSAITGSVMAVASATFPAPGPLKVIRPVWKNEDSDQAIIDWVVQRSKAK